MTALPHRNLDVLRAIAVLCVVTLHATAAAIGGRPPEWLEALGHIGVLLFFVHTALVLMSSIERLRSQRGEAWVRTFYLRRAFRIYPLAIAVILACVLFAWPFSTSEYARLHPDIYHSTPAVIANLLLMQNLVMQNDVLVVLWSLPLEVQMYVLLPFAFLAAKSGTVWRWLALAVVAGILVVYLPTPGRERLGMLAYAPCFMAGVLAYQTLRGKPSTAHRGWLVALIAWAAIGVVALSGTKLLGAWDWAFCLGVGLLIPRFRDLQSSPLTRGSATVAKYSYGVYLLHIPALYLAVQAKPELPAALRWAAFPVVLAALSWLAYHAIEEPGIRLGQRLSTGSLPRATANTPAPHTSASRS